MEGLTGKYCFQNIENGGNVENLFEHGCHRLHGYEERKPLQNLIPKSMSVSKQGEALPLLFVYRLAIPHIASA